jgi:glycosyltransferase involved in cell wall biosynthesis
MTTIDFDNIIYNLQAFGGATRYWREMTKRVDQSLPGQVGYMTGTRYSRLARPKSFAKIFHSSHFRITTSRRTHNIVTVYDLIYEKGLVGGMGKLLNLYERRNAVIHADAIICISDSTRRDMIEFYGRRVENKPIFVAHLGCDGDGALVAPGAREIAAPVPEASEAPYFLYTGGRGSYKNFSIALRAFAAGRFAKDGIRLLCTGHPFSREENERIERLGLGESVKAIGKVADTAMRRLYGNALALLYPSSYEGFGLPPLEAMMNGCPVICSRSSSLPEVVGDAGLLVESGSEEAFLLAMRQLLDIDTRSACIARGFVNATKFTWERSAQQHLDVYRTFL